MKNKIISLLIFVVLVFLLYYFTLPALNLSDPKFWTFIIISCIICLFTFLPSLLMSLFKKKRASLHLPKTAMIFLETIIGIYALILIINLICSPLFNSNKYASRITVDETRSFTEDVAPVDFTKIPLLDKESSQKLGDRKMGQATEWVSQYYVSDLYTQINYNDSIIRVTPIEYAGIIKYFTNRKNGIKGYITVDSVDGDANLVTLEKGMKYMPSAYFFENAYRKVRFNHPFTIFDKPNFEIDNDGNPFWIFPTIKYSGVGLKKAVTGVVILNAITGETKKYAAKDVPSWVDHVYPAELIETELNNWGEYKEGFFNSIFGQKNVVNTTKGYNYLVMNDDIYLYTGITSVSTDESNLGFVLVNLRTKETHYYSAPGAEEYSAMASAEGLVQEKGYISSFPLLINLNGKPTYLLSLKDNAGLVKMYGLVDVEDYQKVVVNDSSLGIEAAAKKYLGEADIQTGGETKEETIVVSKITSAVIDGNTYYYITDNNGKLFSSSIKNGKNILPFIKSGDKLSISYQEGKVNNIILINEED